MPGIAYYSGSKFALEGISEALAQEVKGLGVKVTAIAPGSFRTEWAGRSMVRSERSISDYDTTFDPLRKRRREYSGRQVGDPGKAARALLELVELEEPPTHLLLGSDALNLVKERLAALHDEIQALGARFALDRLHLTVRRLEGPSRSAAGRRLTFTMRGSLPDASPVLFPDP
jgi:short-subunit dehydrogenase